MSNTLQIDLDSLSPEKAEQLAGFILTYAGVEPEISPEQAFSRTELKIAPVTAITIEPGMSVESAITVCAGDAHTGAIGGFGITSCGPALVPRFPALTLDSKGFPWNERIHSSSKELNKDGSWRKKRGIDDATVAQVEGELQQLMAIPSPTLSPAPGAAALPSAPVSAPIMAASPSVLPPPPPPVPPTADAQQGFINLYGKTMAAIGAGKLTMEQLNMILAADGIAGLPLLAARLDLVPKISSMIDGLIAAHG
jgi:hypothetical protein